MEGLFPLYNIPGTIPADVFASGGRDGNIMLWDVRNAGVSQNEGISRARRRLATGGLNGMGYGRLTRQC